jgi:PAS domain S-box-containing protein
VGRRQSSSSSAEATLDALADPVLVCDASHHLEYVNAAAARLLGADQESLVGQDAASIVPERLRTVNGEPFFSWLVRHHREVGRPVRAPIRRPDGVEILKTFQLTLSTGAIVLVLHETREGVEIDPLRLDAAQLSPETSYRAVFEAVPVGVMHFDAKARITACNDVFVAQMGSSRALLLGLDMSTLPDENVRGAVREALAGRIGRYERVYTSVTGGRSRSLVAVFSPIMREGVVEGGVGVVDDVTERREIESRLAQGERMASLGRLAAGVAHEINNPLAYVRTSLDLVRREIVRFRRDRTEERLDRMIELAEQADDGVERVRVIVGDLRTFSRGDEGSVRPVDLHRVIEAAVNLAHNEIRHRAELVREIGPIPYVHGNASRYVQVLVNLLVNAAQAITEGDALHNRVTIRAGRASNDRVFLEVEDTGSGIEPAIVPRVFEPFWTSKAPGVGTGLGLSICHGIVTAAGGEIRVAASVVGKGTTFRVELPVAAAPEVDDEVTGQIRTRRAAPTRARILIVDDEVRLAATLKIALGERYDVVTRESGRDAIDGLEEDAKFDLVLCDLMMPDVSGIDVYERLCASWPELASRFVFMTGGAFTERARTFLRENRVRRIAKPFTLDRIDELLTGGQGEPLE